MEFDKSRVYTALNADELKVGDKVIVASCLQEMENAVEYEIEECICTLKKVMDTSYSSRFCIGDDERLYSIVYLVERAPEKKWRPYADCDEMIKDFKTRYEKSLGIEDISVSSPMWHPLIWVKCDSTSFTAIITAFDNDPDSPQIYIGGHDTYSMKWLSLENLFNCYTYLDGSPCGVEE